MITVNEGTKVSWQGLNNIITAELHCKNGKWYAVLPNGKFIRAGVVKNSKTFTIYGDK